jgi:hypothetical protein
MGTMSETIRVPYGDGIEDAIAVELPDEAQLPAFDVALPEGRSIKVQLRIVNIFRLLTRTDEKGDPVYLISVQFKTETVSKETVKAEVLDDKR